ncbi:MAG: hypothetical protein GWO02_14370 [Gammaproteobacteria bacterium]|nr:hypothetical protein [Gammaproteobacteria bacterium]
MPNLPRLSGERVREEILKVLAAPVPSPGLALYRRSGALTGLVPELARLDDASWELMLGTIDRMPEGRLRLRLAQLLAPAAPEIEPVMRRLRFSNAEIRDVLALSAAVERPLPDADDAVAGRRWLRDVGPQHARDTLRLHFRHARARGASAAERAGLAARGRRVLAALRRGEPVRLADLAIDGNDLQALGLRPGPEIGRVLDVCLDAVIGDPERNEREWLLEFARSQMTS